MPELTCFKACDIRGKIGLNIDESIVYNIGCTVAQHFNAKAVVIGFNARPTSPTFAAAAVRSVMDAGASVLNISLVGANEMYWPVN